MATGTIDFHSKSKTAEEFLARTASSDLSSYSSTTLSIDSEDAKDDLVETQCSFWEDVGTQTFGLAQGESIVPRKHCPLIYVRMGKVVLINVLFMWVLTNSMHACRTQPQHQHQQ